MSNLTVKGVPDVVPQGSNQTLTTSVLVDMSVPATFRYDPVGKGQMVTELITQLLQIYPVILSFTVYEVIKLSISLIFVFFLSFICFELPVCHNSTTAVKTEA